MIEKSKIEKGVISMVKTNMGVMAGEEILVLTDIPTSEEWAEYSREKLNDALRRAFLAKVVSDVAAKGFPQCKLTFLAYYYPLIYAFGIVSPSFNSAEQQSRGDRKQGECDFVPRQDKPDYDRKEFSTVKN